MSVINQYLHLICDERLFLRFTQFADSSSTVKIILIQFVTQLWLQSIKGTVSQLKGFLKFVVMVFKGEGCRARKKCRSGQLDFLVGQVTFKYYL